MPQRKPRMIGATEVRALGSPRTQKTCWGASLPGFSLFTNPFEVGPKGEFLAHVANITLTQRKTGANHKILQQDLMQKKEPIDKPASKTQTHTK